MTSVINDMNCCSKKIIIEWNLFQQQQKHQCSSVGLHILVHLEPLTQILNAFFRSSVSYFETEIIMSCVTIMAGINFFEVGQQMCR